MEPTTSSFVRLRQINVKGDIRAPRVIFTHIQSDTRIDNVKRLHANVVGKRNAMDWEQEETAEVTGETSSTAD